MMKIMISDDRPYSNVPTLLPMLLVLLHSFMLSHSTKKTPYHTSALTGTDWVCELLNGHPERIRCELGVHKEVFHELIAALKASRLQSSRHVSLEEQLAIFLYTCMTGLSLRHVSERFQHVTETTSK